MVARSNVNDLTDTTIAPASPAMATNAGMPTSDGAPAAIEFDLSQSPPSDSRKRFEAEAAKRRAMKRTLTPARTRACGPVDVQPTDRGRRRSRAS